MRGKKFRMFAGPNGSGKSTLIQEVYKTVNIGYFINADNIEASLVNNKYIDLASFIPVKVSNTNWKAFLLQNQNDERLKENDFSGIEITENILTSKQKINSYHTAIIAEFLRGVLFEQEHTFSFETVMSHPSKIKDLVKAKQLGFSTYLYFICTRDPSINIERVKNRTLLGGHSVSEEKMIKRYYASLDLLSEAFVEADRAFIIDSTTSNRSVILEKTNNSLIFHSDTLPQWVDSYLLKRLNLSSH